MATDSKFPENDDPVCDDVDLDALVDEATRDQVAEQASEVGAVSNVVPLLPVHAAPNTGKNSLKVSRGVGRPRKVERMPTTSDLEYHAQIAEAKGKFIDGDSVVQASVRRAEPMAMLAVIKTEVAKESAALHFQRIENEKFGRDTSQVSSRRIDALKKIADIELEIKKLGGDTIDVTSEKMTKVFTFFIGTVRSILEENLTPEQLDLIFNRLQTEFEGWQEKLSAQLR